MTLYPRYRQFFIVVGSIHAVHREEKRKEIKRLLTVVVLVDNGDLGPVEKLHDVLISGVEQTLCGIEVDAKLFRLRVQVQPGFQMWNVQCVADAVNVLAQDRIRWAEYCLHPVLDLLTRCNKSWISVIPSQLRIRCT